MNSLWPQIPHVNRFFSGSPLTSLLKANAVSVPYDYATVLICITVVNKSLVTVKNEMHQVPEWRTFPGAPFQAYLQVSQI